MAKTEVAAEIGEGLVASRDLGISALLDVCDELRELHVVFVGAHRRLMIANADLRTARRQARPHADRSDTADGGPTRF